MIKFRMPLLAVRDVEISKKFYHDLFDQEVVLDLGGNVTFSGGFSVQQDFDRLTACPNPRSCTSRTTWSFTLKWTTLTRSRKSCADTWTWNWCIRR